MTVLTNCGVILDAGVLGVSFDSCITATLTLFSITTPSQFVTNSICVEL